MSEHADYELHISLFRPDGSTVVETREPITAKGENEALTYAAATAGRVLAEKFVTDYELVASHEDEYNRHELRHYPDRWEMVRLRRAVGGGWYVRDSLYVRDPAKNEDAL